jgi:hypothetical protein
MHWYKVAKLKKQALKIEDLEEFYLIASITKDKMLHLLKNDEDFKNYIIKKMEYFKNKYLNDGVFAINQELSYIKEEIAASLNGLYKALKLFENRNKWSEMGFGPDYGGKGWARVTKALMAIVDSSDLYKIEHNNNELLTNIIYRLIFSIDHFNDICHNTGIALPKMMDKYQNVNALAYGKWEKIKDRKLLEDFQKGLIDINDLKKMEQQSSEETLDFLRIKGNINTDMREVLVTPIQKIDKELVNALNEIGESIKFFNNPKQILNYYQSKGQLTYDLFAKILPSFFQNKYKSDLWKLSLDYADFFNKAILDAIDSKNAHLLLQFISIYFKLSSSVKNFVSIEELMDIFVDIAQETGHTEDLNKLDSEFSNFYKEDIKEAFIRRLFMSSIVNKDFKYLYKYLYKYGYLRSVQTLELIIKTMMNDPQRFNSETYDIFSITELDKNFYNLEQKQIIEKMLSQTLLETKPSLGDLIVFVEQYYYLFNYSAQSDFFNILSQQIASYINPNNYEYIENIGKYSPIFKRTIDKYL